MTRAIESGVTTVGVGAGLPHCRRPLVLAETRGAGQEELRERRVEDRRLIQSAGEYWPTRVTDGALVSEIHEAKRASRVVQFFRADAEAMIAAKRRAEGREIFRQTAERVHQERGVDTDPNPKSVSRL
jgi:hypothetical protein